jgi:hypothetical protein
MPTFSPKPFDSAASADLCATISLREVKGGQFFAVSLSAKLQVDLFGVELTKDDGIALMLSTDAGKVHVLALSKVPRDSVNALPFTLSGYHTATLKIAPWCQVAPGKRPAAKMPIIARPEKGGALFKLPEWARPPVASTGKA